MDWFLYNRNAGLKWTDEDMTKKRKNSWLLLENIVSFS